MLDAHITKRRREFTVEAHVCVAAAETVAIFGASGAGKSTLLSCIAGVEQPDGGHIRLDNRELLLGQTPLYKRNIGYLTQSSLLFPHLSVAGNVSFGLPSPLERAGYTRPDAWIAEVRARFDLSPIWHAPTTRISGGQAQRVALARMFARRPVLVLLDEPFAGLDRVVVRDLIAMLAAWQREHGSAMIIVDHQENVLRKLCSRVYAMERGRVIQHGSWDELRARPASAVLAELLAPL